MKRHLWLTMVTCLACCLDQELQKAIDYLMEKVRVLNKRQEEDEPILLDNHQRMSLAPKARQLARRLLEQTPVLLRCCPPYHVIFTGDSDSNSDNSPGEFTW